MGKQGTITTGVDNLVSLVADKKKISISEAAKTLGVPRELIEEWTDFLEEKGVIRLEYSFTTPYLHFREADAKTVERNTRMFTTKKESFVRQIDATLQFIEKHAAGLDKVKEQFDKINAELEGKVHAIRDELKELDRFDALKRELGSDLSAQYDQFRKRMEKIEQRIHEREEAYDQLIAGIEREERSLEGRESRLEHLKEMEREMERKFAQMRDQIAKLQSEERKEVAEIENEKSAVARLKLQSQRLKREIDRHRKDLAPLLREYERIEHDTKKARDEVMAGFEEHLRQVELKESQAAKVKETFEKYLKQKVDIDILMDRLTSEVAQLESEFRVLRQEAKIITATAKDNHAETLVEKLEKRLEQAFAHKKRFEDNVARLREAVIHGDSPGVEKKTKRKKR